jgi:hypothetical protein
MCSYEGSLESDMLLPVIKLFGAYVALTVLVAAVSVGMHSISNDSCRFAPRLHI